MAQIEKLFEGIEKSRRLRRREFNQLLDLDALFISADIDGIEDVNGSSAFKILMIPRNDPGVKEYRFFDQESGVLVRSMLEQPGKSIQDTYVSDYRQVGPIKLPFKRTRMANSAVLTESELVEVKANEPLPPTVNDLPIEIKVLLSPPPTERPGPPATPDKK